MALPSGKPQDSPTGVLERAYQWVGFGVLVIRICTAALAGRFRQRWNGKA